MTRTFDVVICGLGIMGSAALYALARRGQRVLGIDRFPAGHDRGSSHGATRIIRLAYWEHPSYVPLLRRAYELWRDLETEAGRPLLHITGIAEIGPPGGMLVSGTLAAARAHNIAHELLAAPALMQRYPAFRVPRHYVGVFQPDGGFVEAQPAVCALQALAQKNGALIRIGDGVRAIETAGEGVRIRIGDDVIEAGAAIVAAGPWTATLLPGVAPLRVTRQVMIWFAPVEPESLARFPVFLIESSHGVHYGFPPFGGAGVKVAKHHHADETVDPDQCDRTITAADEALIRAALADHLPAANGAIIDSRTCFYTKTPDGDFVVDRMPGADNVIVASPCSGHGFKFAPVIGEILADLAITGATDHDISRFRLRRFR